MGTCTIGILSDVHYAGAAEQARGHDFELRAIPNPAVRKLAHLYRHYLWQRHPMRNNHLLDQFIGRGADFDYVVANGDYSCNTAFVGLSDDAACQSVLECVGKLRQRFGANLRVNCGDHELGKVPMFASSGGLRLASWRRGQEEVKLDPFWRLEIGSYVVLGFVSSLVALPAFAFAATAFRASGSVSRSTAATARVFCSIFRARERSVLSLLRLTTSSPLSGPCLPVRPSSRRSRGRSPR